MENSRVSRTPILWLAILLTMSSALVYLYRRNTRELCQDRRCRCEHCTRPSNPPMDETLIRVDRQGEPPANNLMDGELADGTPAPLEPIGPTRRLKRFVLGITVLGLAGYCSYEFIMFWFDLSENRDEYADSFFYLVGTVSVLSSTYIVLRAVDKAVRFLMDLSERIFRSW